MASIDCLDPQTRSGGKSKSSMRLIALNFCAEFDQTLFDLILKLHIFQWPNGNYGLVMDLKKLDSDEQTSDDDKAERLKRLKPTNVKVIGAL